jgi:Fe2+ or Zn2+ uptake regulation protein
MPESKLELLGRDAKNPWHVRRALEILTESGSVRITEEVRKDVHAEGLVIDKRMKTIKNPKKLPVIGQFFFLEEGPMFPDNVMVKCDDCGKVLQIRPHSQRSRVRLCCFCAVDRARQ